MRSLFDSLHPPSSFDPLSRRPALRRVRGNAVLWGLLCLLAGGLQAASVAWPLANWSLPGTRLGQPSGWWQIASLALLVLALQNASGPAQGAWRAWVFSIAWLGGTFWWLFVSMHTYGGLAAWMAVLAVLALAVALALFYAAAAAALCAWAAASRVAQALLFASLWTLAELARGRWLSGFPWGAGGYAQVDLMAAWAPLVGVYGMGWLAALLAYALASLATQALQWLGLWLPIPWRRRLGQRTGQPAGGLTAAASLRRDLPSRLRALFVLLVLAALLLSLVGGGAAWRDLGQRDTASSGTLRVWLLQGNIAQDEKFVPGTGMAQALQWYPQQIAAAVQTAPSAAPQLVVTPETALPLLPQQMSGAFWRSLLDDLADQPDAATAVHALIGLPLGNFVDGYTNSAWGLSPASSRAARAILDQAPEAFALQDFDGFFRYDKYHLVPFGEFVPPLFRWFVDLMDIPLGDFSRGALPQSAWELAGQRIAVNICYEDLFGEELAASFRDPQNVPTVLVNLTNIAWFGDTIAIDQHLHISRLRALELGRPMLRATNTGATAVIDHRGVVTHKLARLTRDRLEATVQGRSGLTPYARWASRWGLWPLWMGCAGLALGLMASRLWATRWRRV